MCASYKIPRPKSESFLLQLEFFAEKSERQQPKGSPQYPVPENHSQNRNLLHILLSNGPIPGFHSYSILPETGFFGLSGNPIEKIFYGRLPVKKAASGYYFSKSSVLQRLTHQLKYSGNREVGRQLGRWMGLQLQNSGRFTDVEALVPLPLFPEKEKKRGYNQATLLCEGIADICNLPVLNDAVRRKRYTDTQTKKGRTERLKNVEGSFELGDAQLIRQKHVLLVDDVITTGATLEACGFAITQAENTALSIATLAWSSNE